MNKAILHTEKMRRLLALALAILVMSSRFCVIAKFGVQEPYMDSFSEIQDYKAAEEDGIADSVFYFDKDTWLQVGSTLKNADGQLVGEYWFYDIQLNPDFKPDPFTRENLAR